MFEKEDRINRLHLEPGNERGGKLTEAFLDRLGVVVVSARSLASLEQPLLKNVFGADEEQNQRRRAHLKATRSQIRGRGHVRKEEQLTDSSNLIAWSICLGNPSIKNRFFCVG